MSSQRSLDRTGSKSSFKPRNVSFVRIGIPNVWPCSVNIAVFPRSRRLRPAAATVVTPDVPGDHLSPIPRERAVDNNPLPGAERAIRGLIGLYEVDHDAL